MPRGRADIVDVVDAVPLVEGSAVSRFRHWVASSQASGQNRLGCGHRLSEFDAVTQRFREAREMKLAGAAIIFGIANDHQMQGGAAGVHRVYSANQQIARLAEYG